MIRLNVYLCKLRTLYVDRQPMEREKSGIYYLGLLSIDQTTNILILVIIIIIINIFLIHVSILSIGTWIFSKSMDAFNCNLSGTQYRKMGGEVKKLDALFSFDFLMSAVNWLTTSLLETRKKRASCVL